MKQIWLLLRAQGRKNLKKTIILTGIVLMLCAVSTFSYRKNEEEAVVPTGKIRLGVANEDTSEYAELLIHYFKGSETFSSYVEVIEDTAETLESRIQKGELDAYLVIPEAFAESLMGMENLPVRAAVSLRQPTKALILRQVFNAYASYIEAVEINCSALYDIMAAEGFSYEERNVANVKISLDLIFTALGKDEFFRVRTIEAEKEPLLSEHYMFNVIFFVLFFGFLPIGLKMQDLKQNGMIQRMKTMHFSVGNICLACIVPYALLLTGLLLVVLYLNRAWDAGLFASALCLCIPLPVFLQFMGIVLRKRKDYLFAFSVLLLLMAILGGGIVPVQYLPDFFAAVAKIMPNYRFTALLTGTAETESVLPVFISLLCAAAFLLCGSLYLHSGREGRTHA